MITFRSTRSDPQEIDFFAALLANLSPDGGLYYPTTCPAVSLDALRAAYSDSAPDTDAPRAYSAIASAIANSYHPDLAYTPDIYRTHIYPFTPRLRIIDRRHSILELFHGPTCAFKDFGASFLAYTLEQHLGRRKTRALILTATSGDTGSAVAAAFHGKRNIQVVVLYPGGRRISDLQERQITTLGGNITAIKVDGTFDDCQRMVKSIFANPEASARLHAASANSINIGRLLPQSFYYYYAYFELHRQLPELAAARAPIYFCVPSGNLGNLTAGVMAAHTGLPVAGFLAASNANRVFPRYIATAAFRPRASKPTISNAMDVGNPSNFERLLSLYGQDHKALARDIAARSISDRKTRRTIAHYYRTHNLFVDPHTATGLSYTREMSCRSTALPAEAHTIVLATAAPAKFPEVITPVTHTAPPVPAQLAAVTRAEKQFTPMGADNTALLGYLENKFG